MKIGKRLKRALKSFWCIYITKCTPVLIYAPGRVGSVSMVESFDHAGVLAIKLENLEREDWTSTNFVREIIVKNKIKAQVITLVREPVSLLVAYYFSIIPKHPELINAAQNKDLQLLGQEFTKRCLDTWPFEHFLMWYERELPKTIGVDVFSKPFIHNQRWSFIEHETYPTLILRSDLSDHDKEAAIEMNFNHRIHIQRSNIGSEKKLAEVYEQFKREFKLSPKQFERIYNTKVAKHFFNDEDYIKARNHWCNMPQK